MTPRRLSSLEEHVQVFLRNGINPRGYTGHVACRGNEARVRAQIQTRTNECVVVAEVLVCGEQAKVAHGPSRRGGNVEGRKQVHDMLDKIDERQNRSATDPQVRLGQNHERITNGAKLFCDIKS